MAREEVNRSPLPVPRSPTLVIHTAFLGDVVLATPLLSVLAAEHGPVDVVTTPAAAALLETHPAVRRVWRYDKRGRERGLAGLRHLAAELRAEGFARAVLPHGSWRSAALAKWAGIRHRIGFDDAPARLTYTERVPRPHGGHEAERLLALARGAGRRERGAGGPTPAVSLGITGEDRAAADHWLAEHGVAPGFLALAPGSIWGTKRWGGYDELALRLVAGGRSVVLVGGPEDAALAAAVVAAGSGERGAGNGRIVSAAGELPLRVSAALLERAEVLVTNDSAPLHLATAVGTRIVAIFGPTVPEFGFGPRGPRDLVVEHVALDCRPCSRHGPRVCPLGHHRCMGEIGVERVLDAVASRVEGQGTSESGGESRAEAPAPFDPRLTLDP
jgi:heptosyltransferase-2